MTRVILYIALHFLTLQLLELYWVYEFKHFWMYTVLEYVLPLLAVFAIELTAIFNSPKTLRKIKFISSLSDKVFFIALPFPLNLYFCNLLSIIHSFKVIIIV